LVRTTKNQQPPSRALTGWGYDSLEATQIEHEKQLSLIRAQNYVQQQKISDLIYALDRAMETQPVSGVFQVFFDEESSSLRAGSLAQLEVIAEDIKRSPRAWRVQVSGHTDDSGNADYNRRLAESRARSVSAFLASKGVSLDQIKVDSFGSQRPLASNDSAEGRQLNRRVDIFLGRATS
jgi:OmpA-OmpF porin, OOP family